MTAIRRLLNPLPEISGTDSDFNSPEPTVQTSRDKSFSPPARKKPKMTKDAAVFTRGSIRGECRYPPNEYQDALLTAKHEEYRVCPMGEIADYARHIPYTSERKQFYNKTNRESFEVFQYKFQPPGSDIEYVMLWDYNIGLVRTTPLFKCTGHSKTTPAKMLNRNPGLRDICHSITGGSLVAQGYWMPYEAAKAIAATFCWEIRYALTPVFGVDFPSICLPPGHSKYGDMTIDPDITKQCTRQAQAYKEIEISQSSRASTTTPGPTAPNTPINPRHRILHTAHDNNSSSNYSTDTSTDDNYGIHSPDNFFRPTWTPSNPPRSTPRILLPPPRNLLESIDRAGSGGRSRRPSSPPLSPRSRRVDTDEGYDGDHSSGEEMILGNQYEARSPSDLEAALLLTYLKDHGREDTD